MARNFDNLDPSLLADLDSEAEFAKTSQRRKYMPKLKLDRGESVLVRYLPVEIGANKSWLGRIGQHWVHNRAVYCRRITSPHLGGDPKYDCKICALLEKAARHSNPKLKERGDKCIAEPRWFAVVITLAKIGIGKARPEQIPPPHCWTAHEFAMYRTQFDQLRMIAAQFAIKGTKGIIDIDSGQDIWIQRTGRGYNFQPAGSNPIYGDETNPQEIINTIWSSIIMPDVQMPDDATEAEYFHKIKEFVTTGGGSFDSGNSRGGGGNRGGRGGGGPATQDLDDDEPASLAQFGRGSAASPEDTSLESLDDAPAPPAAAVRPEPAAPQVQAPASVQAAPQVQAAPVVQAPADDLAAPAAVPTAKPPTVQSTPKLIQQPQTRTAPAPQAPAPVQAPAPQAPVLKAPLFQSPQPQTRPAPQVQAAPALQAPPSAPQVNVQAAPQIAATDPIDEDEDPGVAPEVIDAAPPIADPSLTGQAAPVAAAPVAPQAPPAVKARGTKLGSALTSRLSAFQQTSPTTS